MTIKVRLIIIIMILIATIIKFIAIGKEIKADSGLVKIEGIVASVPIIKIDDQNFIVNHVSITSKSKDKIEFGDLIIVVGRYHKRLINPIYQEKYLKAQEIKIVKKYKDITIKKRIINYPNIVVLYHLNQFKYWAISQYETRLSYNASALLSGMVLGAKEALSYDLYEKMKASGLAHLVVASGSNIALVAATILAILSPLARVQKYGIAILIVWMYAIIAGMEAPIIRASIMISAIWASQLMGRKTSSIWILLITALTMIIIDPKIIFSISFQLSFTATAGLILYAPIIEKKLLRLLPKSSIFAWITPIISQPIAVQILITPLLLHYFGTTNLLSILANIAVALLVTPIVLGGMLLLPLSLFPVGDRIITIPLELALRYLNWVGGYTAGLNFASLNQEISWPSVIIYWVVSLFFLIKLNNKIDTTQLS